MFIELTDYEGEKIMVNLNDIQQITSKSEGSALIIAGKYTRVKEEYEGIKISLSYAESLITVKKYELIKKED